MEITVVDRVFGAHQISIGTSLAVEAVTATGEFEGKSKPDIQKYNKLLLNVRTLVRNAHGAFEDLKDAVRHETLLEAIKLDIEAIKEVVSATSPNTLCVPYFCTYESKRKTFPLAVFKTPQSIKQVAYSGVEEELYKTIEESIEGLVVFDTELSGSDDTLIVTHMPQDLLSVKKFPKLSLLESHTGKIKNRTEWYTKLNGKDPNVPFNRVFLQLFGDGVMFTPQDLKVRRVVRKIAAEHNWNQTTTKDKINYSFQRANEPNVKDFYRALDRS